MAESSNTKSRLESWGATLASKAPVGLTLRRSTASETTTPSSSSSLPSRGVNVSVVGLSGGEKEKGVTGAGKSCLCNRFVYQAADDYSVDHISVFSQSDFSSRVVNNDHFLYWGNVDRRNDEGIVFRLSVVEQTEFVDDASFKPFVSSGKSESYIKRCCSTRLLSAEKLMYICKDQLGIEHEYEQRLMPEGRFVVDGFIVVFDVSYVPERGVQSQTEMTIAILNSVLKTKKPVVLVATKCDEANELMVRELERLVNRREFKSLNVPVIETSAHENINVDTAFFTLAQLVDKTRGRSRIPSYVEAAHYRREQFEVATEGYVRILRTHVQNYAMLWTTALKKLSTCNEYHYYVEVFGKDSAQRLFRRHVKKLKDEYLGEKIQRYFDVLPEVLHEMFPDINALQNRSWEEIKTMIRGHDDFDHFFVEYGVECLESDLLDSSGGNENRLPTHILEMPDAQTVFDNYRNQLDAHQRMLEMRADFKELLSSMGCVTPGKALDEVKVLFLGRECFENLSEKDISQVYETHQRDIIQRAKKNFQELLLERSSLFFQFRNTPSGTITQDDIAKIADHLKDDFRWKALDRLETDRKLLLFQHLGFVHCPIREHCPAFPHCTDSLAERMLARLKPNNNRRPWSMELNSSSHLNIIVLGQESTSSVVFYEQLKGLYGGRQQDFEFGNQCFSLDFRAITGDIALPGNAFRTQDFLPHGCICVFSDESSLGYLRLCFEHNLLSNLEQEDRLPFQGLPLIIAFLRLPTMGNRQADMLAREARNLAQSLQSSYVEVFGDENRDRRVVLPRSAIEDALTILIKGIKERSGILGGGGGITAERTATQPSPSWPPDMRIILCILCGDPFPLEHLLAPLLAHPSRSSSTDRSFTIELSVKDNSKSARRRIEIIVSSYHGAADYHEELVHGFILAFSSHRPASLATLSAFSADIPELPLQLLAVTDTFDSSGSETLTNHRRSEDNDDKSVIVHDASRLAESLQAHFALFSPQLNCMSLLGSFLAEVDEKRAEIERAFSTLEDELQNSNLDDSGEGTLERPNSNKPPPLPPTRHDSSSGRGLVSVGGKKNIVTVLGRGLATSTSTSRSGSAVDLGEEDDDNDHHDQQNDDENDENDLRRPMPNRKSVTKRPARIGHSPKKAAKAASFSPSSSSRPLLSSSSSSRHQSSSSALALSLSASSAVSRRHELEERNRGGGPPLPPQRLRTAHSVDKAVEEQQQRTSFIDAKGGLVWPSTPPEPAPSDPGEGGNKSFLSFDADDGNHNKRELQQRSCTSDSTDSWVDDSVFLGTNREDGVASKATTTPGSFTTGRAPQLAKQKPIPPPVKPRAQGIGSGPPGKLNLSDFHKLSAALSSMQMESRSPTTSLSGRNSRDLDSKSNYATPCDALSTTHGNEYARPVGVESKLRYRRDGGLLPPKGSESRSSSSSDETRSSTCGPKRPLPTTTNTTSDKGSRNNRGKRSHQTSTAIPVSTPKVPQLPNRTSTQSPNEDTNTGSGGAGSEAQYSPSDEDDAYDTDSVPPSGPPPRLNQADILSEGLEQTSVSTPLSQSSASVAFDGEDKLINEKHRRKADKAERQRAKEEERRRLKDEKRQRKEASKKLSSDNNKNKKIKQSSLESESVPLFLEKAIAFIEKEGLDAEGLYRVPGNRAHVDLLFQKFDDDSSLSIESLDIAVNAVATAVKDFFTKRLPPILDPEEMASLESISIMTDRSSRVLELANLLKKLPKGNYAVLKFMFQHFVRVTEMSKDNCMDSKNLAICWWPTLLQYKFGDLSKFEAMRPHLEDIVQTMIDQFRFLFCGQEEVLMV